MSPRFIRSAPTIESCPVIFVGYYGAWCGFLRCAYRVMLAWRGWVELSMTEHAVTCTPGNEWLLIRPCSSRYLLPGDYIFLIWYMAPIRLSLTSTASCFISLLERTNYSHVLPSDHLLVGFLCSLLQPSSPVHLYNQLTLSVLSSVLVHHTTSYHELQLLHLRLHATRQGLHLRHSTPSPSNSS